MNSRDVTEILKIFERRITNLEQRVGELELAYKTTSVSPKWLKHVTTTDGRKDKDKPEKYNDQLSSRTVSYDSSDKVKFRKQEILSIGRSTSTDTGEFNIPGLSINNKAKVSSSKELEDGEIFEPDVIAPAPLSSSFSSIPTKKSNKPPGLERYVPRPARAKKNQANPSNISSELQELACPRSRPKSKSDGPNHSSSSAPTNTQEATSLAKASKTEVHFGLLVQYPSDC